MASNKPDALKAPETKDQNSSKKRETSFSLEEQIESKELSSANNSFLTAPNFQRFNPKDLQPSNENETNLLTPKKMISKKEELFEKIQNAFLLIRNTLNNFSPPKPEPESSASNLIFGSLNDEFVSKAKDTVKFLFDDLEKRAETERLERITKEEEKENTPVKMTFQDIETKCSLDIDTDKINPKVLEKEKTERWKNFKKDGIKSDETKEGISPLTAENNENIISKQLKSSEREHNVKVPFQRVQQQLQEQLKRINPKVRVVSKDPDKFATEKLPKSKKSEDEKTEKLAYTFKQNEISQKISKTSDEDSKLDLNPTTQQELGNRWESLSASSTKNNTLKSLVTGEQFETENETEPENENEAKKNTLKSLVTGEQFETENETEPETEPENEQEIENKAIENALQQSFLEIKESLVTLNETLSKPKTEDIEPQAAPTPPKKESVRIFLDEENSLPKEKETQTEEEEQLPLSEEENIEEIKSAFPDWMSNEAPDHNEAPDQEPVQTEDEGHNFLEDFISRAKHNISYLFGIEDSATEPDTHQFYFPPTGNPWHPDTSNHFYPATSSPSFENANILLISSPQKENFLFAIETHLKTINQALLELTNAERKEEKKTSNATQSKPNFGATKIIGIHEEEEAANLEKTKTKDSKEIEETIHKSVDDYVTQTKDSLSSFFDTFEDEDSTKKTIHFFQEEEPEEIEKDALVLLENATQLNKESLTFITDYEKKIAEEEAILLEEKEREERLAKDNTQVKKYDTIRIFVDEVEDLSEKIKSKNAEKISTENETPSNPTEQSEPELNETELNETELNETELNETESGEIESNPEEKTQGKSFHLSEIETPVQLPDESQIIKEIEFQKTEKLKKASTEVNSSQNLVLPEIEIAFKETFSLIKDSISSIQDTLSEIEKAEVAFRTPYPQQQVEVAPQYLPEPTTASTKVVLEEPQRPMEPISLPKLKKPEEEKNAFYNFFETLSLVGLVKSLKPYRNKEKKFTLNSIPFLPFKLSYKELDKDYFVNERTPFQKLLLFLMWSFIILGSAYFYFSPSKPTPPPPLVGKLNVEDYQKWVKVANHLTKVELQKKQKLQANNLLEFSQQIKPYKRLLETLCKDEEDFPAASFINVSRSLGQIQSFLQVKKTISKELKLLTQILKDTMLELQKIETQMLSKEFEKKAKKEKEAALKKKEDLEESIVVLNREISLVEQSLEHSFSKDRFDSTLNHNFKLYEQFREEIEELWKDLSQIYIPEKIHTKGERKK